MWYYDIIKIINISPKMILPFTGDTVQTVPAKDYTATKACTHVRM